MIGQSHESRVSVAADQLVEQATAQHGTLTKAAYWLLYHWRTAPDAFEMQVRIVVAQRLVARMDEPEYSAWRAWVATPPLDRTAITL